MTDMQQMFDTFEQARAFRQQLSKDKNITRFEQSYDTKTRQYILRWTIREECKDQKRLEDF